MEGCIDSFNPIFAGVEEEESLPICQYSRQ
jgi:hypothetical protein